MAKKSKYLGALPIAEDITKPTKIEIQRKAAQNIFDILAEKDIGINAIEEHLSPSDLRPSFEHTIREKKYSKTELTELLATALSEITYLEQKNLFLQNSINQINSENYLLCMVSSDIQPGGRSPSTYLWSEALQLARDHHNQTGKFMSAAKIRNIVCRNAFQRDARQYIAEVEKKRKGTVPFDDSANPLWMPFNKKFGMPISTRTVSVWLNEANLIGPSKKISNN